MLIDVFPYAYVPQVLHLRMRELADVVDTHLIVEADITHTGERRPFAWPALSQLEAFAPFADKVQWCPITIPPGVNRAWSREEYIRSACLLHARLAARNDDDVILFGDHDEIPHPRALARVLDDGVKRARLWGGYHEWFLNLRAKGSPGYIWEFRQPITLLADDPLIRPLDETTGAELRALQWQGHDALELGKDDPALRGWHMTLQGGAEEVWRKLQIGAHTELQRIRLTEVQYLMDTRQDILKRCPLRRCPDDEMPRSALSERHHYEGMILQ